MFVVRGIASVRGVKSHITVVDLLDYVYDDISVGLARKLAQYIEGVTDEINIVSRQQILELYSAYYAMMGIGRCEYKFVNEMCILSHFYTDAENVFIPFGIEVLDIEALKDMPNLVHIIVPPTVMKITNGTFSGATTLRTVKLLGGVDIAGYAFSDCAFLESVEFPSKLTFIGGYAFERCFSLEKVIIPDGVNVIENGAFSKCCRLKSIYLPDNLVTVNGSVFADCKQLSEVRLPAYLRTIENKAFSNCVSLKELHLPDTLKHIAADAFEGIPDITLICKKNSAGDKIARFKDNVKVRYEGA